MQFDQDIHTNQKIFKKSVHSRVHTAQDKGFFISLFAAYFIFSHQRISLPRVFWTDIVPRYVGTVPVEKTWQGVQTSDRAMAIKYRVTLQYAPIRSIKEQPQKPNTSPAQNRTCKGIHVQKLKGCTGRNNKQSEVLLL